MELSTNAIVLPSINMAFSRVLGHHVIRVLGNDVNDNHPLIELNKYPARVTHYRSDAGWAGAEVPVCATLDQSRCFSTP